MPISANTLFHFTQDFKTLIRILRTKFYPRLCLEQNVLPQIPFRLAVPMVCFCDIPLSQIEEHTSKYGSYAIGVKKSWAIERGVTPVLYVHDNSLIPQTILNEMIDLSSITTGPGSKNLEKMMRYIDTICLMKRYEGFDERSNRNVCFYNEREWRYVPRRRNRDQFCYLLEPYFKEEIERNRINKENEEYGLDFTPDDINYLIVEREDEIFGLKEQVERIKGDFSHKSVELLSTRILSMEKIREDM